MENFQLKISKIKKAVLFQSRVSRQNARSALAVTIIIGSIAWFHLFICQIARKICLDSAGSDGGSLAISGFFSIAK